MKYLFVINPKAGQKKGLHLKGLLHRKIWRNEEVLYKIIVPHSNVELGEKIKDEIEKENFSHVVAVGGDGTIKNILKALIHFPEVKLGIIPIGTGNVLAFNLGISKNIDKALHTVFHGREKIIDVGLVDKKPFTVVAGVGLPASIVESATRKEKMLFGHWAYFIHGLKELFFAKEYFFDLELDGRRVFHRGTGVFITNAPNFLSPFPALTPEADFNDGYLDVLIFSYGSLREDFFSYIKLFLNYLRKKLKSDVKLQYFKAKKVKINLPQKLHVQADGAIVSKTPTEIEILPNRLKVLVPTD